MFPDTEIHHTLQKDFSNDVIAIKKYKIFLRGENDSQGAEIFFLPFNFEFKSDPKGSSFLQYLNIFDHKGHGWGRGKYQRGDTF